MPDFYLGNPNLKRANVRIDWTPDQVREFVKCSEDPIYFISKYMKIVNIDQGLIPFELYNFQKEIVTKIINNRFVICKLPRQSGKTTTVAAMLLWHTIFLENFNIAVLAHKAEQAQEILGRIQLAYENLPKWLQQGVVEWNKRSIELENGSKIKASATSAGSTRGGSYNLIYLDEFAHVDPHVQNEFFASVYPTISSGNTSKVLITSTPRGLELFYKIWKESQEGRNSYVQVDVGWWDVPGRDEKWREETIRNTSEEQFRQEFGCEFLGSSNTLIRGDKLAMIPTVNPIEIRGNDLSIYEVPQKNHNYYCMVDTARGVGGDSSAFVIIDGTTFPYKVVAVYANNKIAPMLFPNIIHSVASYFNSAYVLVEINDIGGQVADILRNDLEYENIFMSRMMGRAGQVITAGFGSAQSSPGVRTTKQLKRIGCAWLKTLIENDRLIINDFNILSELSTFIEKGESFQADEGRHDDMVMCLVLFAWLTNQDYFIDISSTDVKRNLHDDNIKMIEEELSPFGFIDDGRDAYEYDNAFEPL